MKMQAAGKPYDEINVVPMLDLSYVLLVIFIIMTTASVQGIKVNLPKTDSVAPAEKKDPVVVSVDQSGKFFLAKSEIAPELLEKSLQDEKAKDPDIRVQLQADTDVNYGQVAKAMASIERSGITKISVMTAK